ncbi:zinc metalloprotease 2, putative [Eimeria brunetti]|uniref:Zinc metalloprotease 2, putative n=1 Tax=Eimeria brunetti TaxID=51314 RepID=U6LT27_9EIME|nr:zinc metalloprotease 2, putative [Eimeria brunetti]
MVLKVEQVVLRCLGRLAEEGFAAAAVAAALNTMEFSLRELNTGSFPKGLSLVLDLATEANYGRDPVSILRFEGRLQQVREKIERKEPLFQDLIKRYFLKNTHRVTVRLRADPEMEQRELQQEREKLGKIQQSLTPQLVESILADQIALKQKQLTEETPEALASLPVLRLEDVKEAKNEIPIQIQTLAGSPVISHLLPTSNILYAEIFISLADLNLQDLQLLRLFSRLLLETGTAAYTPEQLQHQIGIHTGGIAAATDIRTISKEPGTVADPFSSVGFLVLSGKAMKGKVGELFCLFSSILHSSRVSVASRAKEILRENIAAAEAAAAAAGHRAAARRVLAALTATGAANELRHGIAYRDAAKEMLQEAETNWGALEERLFALRKKLLRKENILINLTGDKETLAAAMGEEAAAAAAAAAAAVTGTGTPTAAAPAAAPAPAAAAAAAGGAAAGGAAAGRETLMAFIESLPVNFVSLGGRLVEAGSGVSAAAFVAAHAVSVHHLWKQVREVGGAYGSSFQFDYSGIYIFSSYRDPQLLQTLLAYRSSSSFLLQRSKTMQQQDTNNAILSVLRDIDAPLPNDQKGNKSFWQAVLETTPADFADFAAKLAAALQKETLVAAVSSQQAYQEANSKDPSLLLQPIYVFADKRSSSSSSSSSSGGDGSSSSGDSSSSSSSSNGDSSSSKPAVAVA